MREPELRELMGRMTLREKIGQLVQLSGECFGGGDLATGPAAKIGVTQQDVDVCGSVLNVVGVDKVHEVQDRYLSRSRLGIPLAFMGDVVYGYQTCYPIPLALGCTWDPELIRRDYQHVGAEGAAAGCMVTFSPAVDVVRDARWGRVMEMPGGEDPYLGSCFADAMVRGLQEGTPDARGMASCVKHFAGYGAVEAGREYNTVDMSERRLRQEYLPPYKAAVDAGSKMVMTSFNTIDGVPATANRWLVHDVLRGEWGFDGPVITDYAAILELINHGVAGTKEEASKLALDATVDIDMKTDCYAHSLERLVEKGVISGEAVDAACWRVLSLKNELGLFEDPYYGTTTAQAAEPRMCTPEALELARKTASESMVLLVNGPADGSRPALPLSAGSGKIALVGPYADSKDIVGMWAIHADRGRSVTVRKAMEERLGRHGFVYAKGCDALTQEELDELGPFANYASGGAMIGDQEELAAQALAAAEGCDTVVMCMGEHPLQSGEAGARTMPDLPAHQVELVRRMHESGKRVILVVFSGRPLVLEPILPFVDALLLAWWPGTEGGHALCDILFGDANPSGRLNMEMPVNEGQMPLYYAQYATGRPSGKNHTGRFVTGYLDAPIRGLFPFGYGLSYHRATVSDLRLSSQTLAAGRDITATCTVTNESDVAGTEVVQLYLRDCVGSVVRPVRELKGFRRVELAPHESREVSFQIGEEMLRFWRKDMTFGSEPGEFECLVGLNSRDLSSVSFELVSEE